VIDLRGMMISSSHRIKNYKGDCSKLHGHNWEIEVRIEGEGLNNVNMLVDFRKVKQVLREELERLDHTNLNKVLNCENLTCEVLSYYLYQKLATHFFGMRIKVFVWETPNYGCSYNGRKWEIIVR